MAPVASPVPTPMNIRTSLTIRGPLNCHGPLGSEYQGPSTGSVQARGPVKFRHFLLVNLGLFRKIGDQNRGLFSFGHRGYFGLLKTSAPPPHWTNRLLYCFFAIISHRQDPLKAEVR